MRMRRHLLAGWAVIAVSGGLVVVGHVAARITGTTLKDPLFALSIALLGVVGGVVILKQPGNRIGLVLALAGMSGGLAGLGAGLGAGDATRDALLGNTFLDAGPVRLVFVALSSAGFFTFAAMTLGLLPLLFPSGTVPSPRWRWVARVLVAGTAAMAVLGLFAPELCQNPDAAVTDGSEAAICVANPIGIPGLPPAESVLVLVVFPAMLASMVSLVVRFRRSRDVERLQIKWLTLSLVALLAVVLLEALLLEVIGLESSLLLGSSFDLLGLFMSMVPISIAAAILRYRLYEIDRLISRTATYGLVLGVLGSLFGLAVTLPTVVWGGEDTPAWVVAGSTLMVAALFAPLRRRVQGVVDRRFDRARYDAQRVVDGFGVLVRDATDLGEITGALGRVTAQVLGPRSLGVWTRSDPA